MIKVGVRNLKNELSHYLQYVKNGEKVIVTEHNKVIAEICAPEKKETLTFEEKLIELSKTGEIILAKNQGKSKVKPPKITEKIDWESVLDEVRADRF